MSDEPWKFFTYTDPNRYDHYYTQFHTALIFRKILWKDMIAMWLQAVNIYNFGDDSSNILVDIARRLYVACHCHISRFHY